MAKRAQAVRKRTGKTSTRRSLQRRATSSRRALAASVGLRALPAPRLAPQTELAKLKGSIDSLAAGIGTLQSGLHDVQHMVGEVKKLLGLPKKAADNLKKVSTALGAVQAIATVLALVPGPIGTAGTSTRNALRPLIGPPGSGSLGAARATALDIDKSLKPVRTVVDDLGKAVDKAAGKVDNVAEYVALLQGIVDNLIRRYGDNPPEGVEACCRKLNDAISTTKSAVDEAGRAVEKQLAPVRKALQNLIDGLQPLADVISRCEELLGFMNREPFRSAMRLMNQARNAIEKLYKSVSDWVFKKLVGPLLKSLHIDARKVKAFFDGLLKQLDPMKLVKPWIDKAKASITKAVNQLAIVKQMRALLDDLARKVAKLEAAIAAFLDSACKKVLCEDAVPVRRKAAAARA